MNETLDYIDSYFKNALPPGERNVFEQRIISDAAFAQEVAFYISAGQALRQQLLQQKQPEWETGQVTEKVVTPAPVIKMKLPDTTQRRTGVAAIFSGASPAKPSIILQRRIAVAASLFIVFGVALVLIFNRPSPAAQLATLYVNAPLSSTMDGSGDSLQLGIASYKKGDLATAEKLFTACYAAHPESIEALSYSGRVSLRQKSYDQAISRFKILAGHTELLANPGLFYEAVALLLRNAGGDKEQARQLLEEVVNKDLDKSSEAKELLAKMNP